MSARATISVARAAELADCHPRTIRRAIEKGRLEGVELDTGASKPLLRVVLESFEAWQQPVAPSGDSSRAVRRLPVASRREPERGSPEALRAITDRRRTA